MIVFFQIAAPVVVSVILAVVLRTGDKAVVTFRFMYRPEFMHTGVRLVLREGTTRGMGVITKIYLGTMAEVEAGTAEAVISPLGAGGAHTPAPATLPTQPPQPQTAAHGSVAAPAAPQAVEVRP